MLISMEPAVLHGLCSAYRLVCGGVKKTWRDWVAELGLTRVGLGAYQNVE